MKWISRLIVILGLAVIAFALYQVFTSPRPESSRQRFQKSLQPDSKPNSSLASAAVSGLNPALRKTAAELGFQGDTVEKHVREVEFYNDKGEPVKLKNFDDHWVILNFWATWCPPCREEMPSLENLRSQLDSNRFALITVNVMEEPADIDSFLENEALSLPGYRDPDGRLSEAFRVKGLPVTWIISPDGRPLMRLRGATEWDGKPMSQFLQKLSDISPATK